MEDELLVLLEDRFRIGAQRVDPEFQHAAGAGKRARNAAVALDLAGIADIDDPYIIALRGLLCTGCAERLDLGVCLIEQRLDAAVNSIGPCGSIAQNYRQQPQTN